LSSVFSFVFAFVVMLGVLIFVHELGHFVVAKLCNVRVLKFSLGFGAPIGIGRYRLRFRRGETEYVAAWIPLGGYVKMLGENPDEEDSPELHEDRKRAFNHRPVWQRLLILFAGPAMNLALPVLLFAIVLAIGMPRDAAVVGMVEAASPATEAGLRAGDRLTGLAGEPVRYWDEVEAVVRGRPGARIAVRYERDGTPHTTQLAIGARSGLDAFGEATEIGWAGLGHERLAAVLGILDPDSPAAADGLRSGDRVVAVNETPVADWDAFATAYAAVPSAGPARLSLERIRFEGEDVVRESVEVEVPTLGSPAALGVVPATVLIRSVQPESPAERAGLRAGDLIVAVDGTPVGSFASFAELVRSSEGHALDVAYARGGEQERAEIRPTLVDADVGMGFTDRRYQIGIQADPAVVRGVTIVQREANPLRSLPVAAGMTWDLTKTFLEGLERLVTGRVSHKQLAGPIGIAELAHRSYQQGWDAYLTTLILISINLGILNLLPIPVLDGGQAVLVLIEGIKRSPVSQRTREIALQIGLTMIVVLMGFAFWNDITRNWSRLLDWLREGAGL